MKAFGASVALAAILSILGRQLARNLAIVDLFGFARRCAQVEIYVSFLDQESIVVYLKIHRWLILGFLVSSWQLRRSILLLDIILSFRV